MKLYLVWEMVNPEEFGVILVTPDEEKAKNLSGEKHPSDYDTKKNDDTERWYEERQIDKVYPLEQQYPHAF